MVLILFVEILEVCMQINFKFLIKEYFPQATEAHSKGNREYAAYLSDQVCSVLKWRVFYN